MIFRKKTNLIVLVTAFFHSCNSSSEKNLIQEINSDKISNVSEIQTKKNISFNIFMNDSANISSGYGYDIIMDGQRYIHQTTIPAISGNHFFQNKEDADKVGALVCYKIQHNIMPPTITPHELDSLGITKK